MSDRRALIAEAAAMLRFVLGRRPSGVLVRRYVRAIGRKGATAVPLPEALLRCPGLIALIQPVGKARSERQAVLAERIKATLVLCETSPEGATRFIDDGRLGRAGVLAAATLAAAVEVLLMPVRLVVTRMVWR